MARATISSVRAEIVAASRDLDRWAADIDLRARALAYHCWVDSTLRGSPAPEHHMMADRYRSDHGLVGAEMLPDSEVPP